MFNVTENLNSKTGICDSCGAVGGVFGFYDDNPDIEYELCPDCFLIVMDDE